MAERETREQILLVRLGAMGDILHALPAATSLKRSFPNAKISWVTRRRWFPLFDGNPNVDELVPFERHGWGALWRSWQRLRSIRPAIAFDFQGLIQSALVGRAAGPKVFWGFDRSIAREPLSALFYTKRACPPGPHRIQRNLQLVSAAGATEITDETWLPDGRPEGQLPLTPFVLACPFAGWAGKQWPVSCYDDLGRELQSSGLRLVLNVAEHQIAQVSGLKHVQIHSSSISGLIDATRRAVAIVGVDSGPLHLAAALRKPGVAIFGPTDPASNGPYGGSMAVLRRTGARTSYDRQKQIEASMQAITVQSVLQALQESLYTSEVPRTF